MAASIPEGTWIFIVILAVIILAILSNDSISRSSSSSRSGSSSSSSSSSGSGSSSDSANPSTDSPPSTTDDIDSSRNPVVSVTESYDSDTGKLRLKAEARSRSDAEIALTGFVMLSFAGDGFRAPNLQNSREVSSGRQHILEVSVKSPDDKINAGVVQYRAKTKDTEGRIGTYEDDFELDHDIPDGGSDSDEAGRSVNTNVTFDNSNSRDSSSGDGGNSSSGGDDGSRGDSDGSDINDDSDDSDMSASGTTDISHDAFQKIRNEAEYEENELHEALEDLAKIHDEHRYQSELEEELLEKGKDILEDLEDLSEHLNKLNNGNMPDLSPSEINGTLKNDLNELHGDIIDFRKLLNEEMSEENTVDDLMPQLEDIFEAVTEEEERMQEHVGKVMDYAGSSSSSSHS